MTGGPPPPGPWAGPPPRASTFGASTGSSWLQRGGWWFLVTLVTFGVLTAIPLFHAAARIRQGWAWVAAGVSIMAMVAILTWAGSGPRDARGEPVGVEYHVGYGLYFAWFLAMFGLLAFLRTKAYPPRAIAAALEARRRRTTARRLAAGDPMLARELRIGRPDLYRTYDDGGLVDVNEVGGEIIARVCGIDLAHGAAIVGAREAAGRFGAVEDVFARVELPVHIWDVIRDRGIVLG